ncbi:fungal-specific transcription factor domain-containing protein [Exophiala viscosa]|uniref:Fungal-specific transcription factor domain-containing protein n=1 Tax=Exophiala viscosa TaxID=2486360 RepID=A0AAN6DW07_9EURO|nr:fungal-specific transcription factor domain-containing protein [Exophiala viscosa]
MRRPVCGLCLRTGNTCSFPAKRKKPTIRKPQLKTNTRKIGDSLSRLVQILEAVSQTPSDGEAPNGKRELSQGMLRDSLKDIIAEIKSSEDQQPPNHEPPEQADHQYSVSDEDNLDDEDIEPDDSIALPSAPLNPDKAKADGVTATTSTADAGISCSLAIDLVNLFFDKVQPWLAILHRPRFQARYERKLLADGDVMKGLSVEESLLFYSMFALSARFSNHPAFHNIPPNKRGQTFAERARDVYTQARALKTPALMYLQGCILLAFYFYSSGPTHQGWILIGVCVRLGYELGLFEIDDDDWTPATPVDHVEKEELRRAWWLIWELDTFASTVSRHPYSIDRKRMSVNLPISDEAWFAELDVPSAQLNLQPGQSWRSLHGSANQDERAWFLLANCLMASFHDRLQQKHDISPEEKLTMENEVCCFKLALPPSLRLDIDTLTFTPATYARCNWIIGIHLMLMATSFMVSGIVTSDTDDLSALGLGSTALSPMRQRAIDLSRIISLWDTRYISVAHPFLTCMMLPPSAVDSNLYKSQSLILSTHDMAKLVLEHFAERWKLGSVVWEIAKMLERGGPMTAEGKQLVKRYAVFFRIPRLGVQSPAFLQSEHGRTGSTTNDTPLQTGQADIQQQQHQLQPTYPSTGLADQTSITNFEPSMFDIQNFPLYETGNDLDLGFSEFFGGYKGMDFILPDS